MKIKVVLICNINVFEFPKFQLSKSNLNTLIKLIKYVNFDKKYVYKLNRSKY